MTIPVDSSPTTIPYPRECTFSKNDWRILANMWYPLALESDIADAPKKMKLLDVDLVIARLGDGYVIAKDVCIHRGAPLSKGWVKDDCLVCPYHGYRYDSEGQCVLVPSHPEWKIPSKLKLQTVRHEIKYGLVWVCLSGDPINQLPDWTPEEEDANYRRFTLGPETWDCSAGRTIENFIDNAHFSFVHQSSFGQEESATMGAEYEFTQDEYTMTMEFDYKATNPDDSPIADVSQLDRHMHRTLFLPFSTRTAISYPEGKEHIIHFNIAPVSARKAQLIAVFHRNFDHHVPEEDLLAWEKKIIYEDKAIIELQKPEEIPLDVAQEVHSKADKASLAFRRWLVNLGLEGEMSA
ncbi:MAG: aromatic ring-hydroxylating dioxygenase subunit alpha [Verrucomicrobia bacterium]|nr:aromatic ring-hydroxylating dioxygenase subunit alpha [Verrucomicrobiota bacterium]